MFVIGTNCDQEVSIFFFVFSIMEQNNLMNKFGFFFFFLVI